MDPSRQLSVITPVSRPELLPLVAQSVPDQAEWLLVTDGALEIPRGLRPHVLIQGPKTRQWGDVQRQLGLEAATRPFVYFLDDDNMMLPVLAELLIPYLEQGNHSGVLFGLLVDAMEETHLWPAPAKIKAGRVDTAMFFGRTRSILDLRFDEPISGRGWPNLHGRRYADFVFLEAFEERFGLSRLPAIYGFHNGIGLLCRLEPGLFADLEARTLTRGAFARVLSNYLIKADVPPWW
ncbi:MAG TPA: glycosyltransferase family A protein [Thermoanaerobaculia bacterium]|nr:glycosyltransferase family A protein [Thermoanaerobaculia bacterium]